MLHNGSQHALELVPFIRVLAGTSGQDACYFYSRLDGSSVRWVSYHFHAEPELTVPDQELTQLLETLVALVPTAYQPSPTVATQSPDDKPPLAMEAGFKTTPAESTTAPQVGQDETRVAAASRAALKPSPPHRQTMGMSGYRQMYGQPGCTNDAEAIESIREYAMTMAALKDPAARKGWEKVRTMEDAQLLEIIGWACTVKSCIAKVQAYITPGQPTRADVLGSGARPIKPVPGRQRRVSDVTGTAIIASRTHNAGRPDPAVRIFMGNVNARHVGDTFDTVHRDNGMPCGVWTVHAVITDGRVTEGAISEGNIRSYRVNHIG
jgi:hypothetical protein